VKAPGAAFAVAGCAGLAAAFAAAPAAARSAAGQDWSPFVLVSGLLLIGMVADGDGLFAAAGRELARLARRPTTLFVGAVVLIGLVTATLNLDTSVAFLTPVLVYTARGRSLGEAPLLYGVLMLSNAGSLLMPGSNLTNLIVLGHLHLSGAHFLARMWLPWLAALMVTAAVIAVAERGSLRAKPGDLAPSQRPVLGLGLAAVAAATVLVVALRASAIPVAAVGVAAAVIRLGQRRHSLTDAADVLGVPVLIGLFGTAVALGTLGRSWAGPAHLLGHLDSWATAALAAITSVLVNNLPAASLLAARTPPHPFALLVGLNLGPNLFVTGSLAWILWLRAARAADSQPSLTKASRLGAVAVPLSMAASLGCLLLTGARLAGRAIKDLGCATDDTAQRIIHHHRGQASGRLDLGRQSRHQRPAAGQADLPADDVLGQVRRNVRQHLFHRVGDRGDGVFQSRGDHRRWHIHHAGCPARGVNADYLHESSCVFAQP
jgi:arsenical pump membrane protein